MSKLFKVSGFVRKPLEASKGGVFFLSYDDPFDGRCWNEGHEGRGKRVAECTDPECVARFVLDS